MTCACGRGLPGRALDPGCCADPCPLGRPDSAHCACVHETAREHQAAEADVVEALNRFVGKVWKP